MTKLLTLSALFLIAQNSLALPTIEINDARYDAWVPVIEPMVPHESLRIDGAPAVTIVKSLQVPTERTPEQPDPEDPGVIDPSITVLKVHGLFCMYADPDLNNSSCILYIDGRSGAGIHDLSPSNTANLEVDFVGENSAGRLFQSFPQASEKENEGGEITRQVPGMVCTASRCKVLLDSRSGVLHQAD